MSKHSHTHHHNSSHHHRPTRAERTAAEHAQKVAAEAARVAAVETARRMHIHAQRASSAETINAPLAAWWNAVGSHPSTQEVAGSPLSASMIVTAQFDSFRAAGKDHIHSAVDGALEQNGKPVKDVTGDVSVVATVSGRVLYAGNWDEDSGISVLIGGDDGKIYGYSHLRPGSVALDVGERIAQTGTIGSLGHSGNAEKVGDCLHYTVRAFNPTKHHEGDVIFSDFKRVEPTIDGAPARIMTQGKPTIIAAMKPRTVCDEA